MFCFDGSEGCLIPWRLDLNRHSQGVFLGRAFVQYDRFNARIVLNSALRVIGKIVLEYALDSSLMYASPKLLNTSIVRGCSPSACPALIEPSLLSIHNRRSSSTPTQCSIGYLQNEHLHQQRRHRNNPHLLLGLVFVDELLFKVCPQTAEIYNRAPPNPRDRVGGWKPGCQQARLTSSAHESGVFGCLSFGNMRCTQSRDRISPYHNGCRVGEILRGNMSQVRQLNKDTEFASIRIMSSTMFQVPMVHW
ncbi:hypothetical protein KCU90_g13, partial [Aureobasidium melanogenum]